jgi:phosphohistidine phosphatase
MFIFLVRHGIAEDHGTRATDAERRLTEEGREKTARVAKEFRKRVPRVSVIFHSPFVRAVETAEIFAGEFPKTRREAAKGLTPMDSAKSALPLLAGFGEDDCVMLVGHEPHLSSLVSLLITGRDSSVVEMKKAGIAGIECAANLQHARLSFLLSPKWL